jgi:hypothetical protein
MMEIYIPPKRRFLQEPHGITTQKTAFFRAEKYLKCNADLSESTLLLGHFIVTSKLHAMEAKCNFRES